MIAFAREGADVVFTHLPSEKSDADELLEILKDEPGTYSALPVDLTDEKKTRDMVKKAAKELGGLDIVVNNAGKQIYNDDITTLSTKQIVDTFTVNIVAMFWVVQEALAYLLKGAAIINTTSIQATQP